MQNFALVICQYDLKSFILSVPATPNRVRLDLILFFHGSHGWDVHDLYASSRLSAAQVQWRENWGWGVIEFLPWYKQKESIRGLLPCLGHRKLLTSFLLCIVELFLGLAAIIIPSRCVPYSLPMYWCIRGRKDGKLPWLFLPQGRCLLDGRKSPQWRCGLFQTFPLAYLYTKSQSPEKQWGFSEFPPCTSSCSSFFFGKHIDFFFSAFFQLVQFLFFLGGVTLCSKFMV